MPGFTEIENRILKEYISNSKLSTSLALIRGVMENIWANDAPRIVQNYTDHGVEHSIRVAGFVEKLLNVNPEAEFSEEEVYILLAGVYLHDIGMQCDIVKFPKIKTEAEKSGAKFDVEFNAKITSEYSPKEQDEIRKNHHYLSAAWIDNLYEDKDSVLYHAIKSIPYDLVDDLMDICKFHSRLPITNCSDSFNHDPKNRKKLVAALLRFADELDVSSSRVELDTVKIFTIKPDNSVYWWLHNYTKVNFITNNKIRVTVMLHPKDFELYGSLIREDYIVNFKSKNLPVLEVLVEHNIPVVIDKDSDVIEYKRAEKFPPEITTALDKKMKDKDDENIDKALISILKENSVLFIGDKVSENSGVKSFGIFIIEAIESIAKPELSYGEFCELRRNLNPESAFKILYDELGDTIIINFKHFYMFEPNPIHYYIANEIKNGRWIFTTNRDNLIEKACQDIGTNFKYEVIVMAGLLFPILAGLKFPTLRYKVYSVFKIFCKIRCL